MSRLAAVRTGQPTQGVGAAPNGKSRPATPAEVADFLGETDPGSVSGIDLSKPLPGEVTPHKISPHAPVSVATIQTAAWLSLSATELEVRKYFRSISKDSGLEMLAKMRRQCDLAATELQQRIDDNLTERCSGCGKTLEEVRKTQWIMQGSDVDPDTGVPMPYRFCGPMCVRERNREKMLPKELRDQKRFDGEDIAEVR